MKKTFVARVMTKKARVDKVIDEQVKLVNAVMLAKASADKVIVDTKKVDNQDDDEQRKETGTVSERASTILQI